MDDAAYLRVLIAAARDPASAPDIDDVCGLLDLPTWTDLGPDAPAIVRAIAALPTFRGQYRRNGLDGYVWNQRADVPAVIDAFAAIGALDTALTLAELLRAQLEADDAPDDDDRRARDAVTAFLTARAAIGGPAFGPDLGVDPIAEVHDAVLSYLDRHAEDVVAWRPSA